MRRRRVQAAVLVTGIAIFQWSSPSRDTAAADTIVMTDRGAVGGAPDGGTIAFKGIPFAAAPVGDRRWRPPEEHAPWAGVRPAVDFGPRCPQVVAGAVVGDEDCLHLNLWKPAAATSSSRLPVMVWLHGGGNHQDFSGRFSGRRWAQDENVVLVTTNYRLGALGFLALAALDAESEHGVSGNYGILDQVAALQWVQRNIAGFGGDPSRVLLFGESAGADDVCVHLASPLAAGLFSSAVMESLVAGCRYPSLARFEETTGARIVGIVGCAGAADAAACMRSRPAAAVVSAVPGQLDLNPRIYIPVVDGFVLPASPLDLIREGEHNQVPFIVGSNADETSVRVGTIPTIAAFRQRVFQRWGATLGEQVLARYPVADDASAQDVFKDATTDEIHTCPTRRVARAAAEEQDAPVFRFLFTHALQNSPAQRRFGASHGFELNFLFERLNNYVMVGDELTMSADMLGYWAELARSGNPNGGTRSAWPQYEADRDPFLRIDTPIQAGTGVRASQCDFWDHVQDED